MTCTSRGWVAEVGSESGAETVEIPAPGCSIGELDSSVGGEKQDKNDACDDPGGLET